jgi:hypothetical protein
MLDRTRRTIRRIFFEFDSPVRRHLWHERALLAAAEGPLSETQRARMAEINDTLGCLGPFLVSLETMQGIGWAIMRARDSMKGGAR